MGRIKVGLQLYSISDYMQKDMDKALGEVKAMGYDYVEFAGYYDKSAEEIKTLLEKYGLECVSIHRGLNRFDDNKESEMNYIRVLGAKYCVIPWYEVSKLAGGEEWENTVKRFTNHAEDMKEIGVKLLYHNHSFEFNKFEGKYLIDHIYETIPPDLLDPEFDTCWVRFAGEDPCRYIEKFRGRVDVLHIKDFTCEKFPTAPVYDLEENGFVFKPCGYGIQNFKEILASAEKSGTKYVIVEQDMHPERDSMEDAILSREYLRSLGI